MTVPIPLANNGSIIRENATRRQPQFNGKSLPADRLNTETRRNGESHKATCDFATTPPPLLDQFHIDQNERRWFGRGNYPASRLGKKVNKRGHGGQDCQQDGEVKNIFV